MSTSGCELQLQTCGSTPSVDALGAQAYAGDETRLQQLIDSAVEANGAATSPTVVRIPAGRYLLHDSLRLRSNLHLVADGQVILEKAPSVSSRLIDIVGYGHSEFRVAEPHLFRPGMGVSIAAGQTVGFGVTVGRITGQAGDTFFIDTPFSRDYRPREGAVAWSMFPIIAGYGVKNVRLSGLILDGGENDPGYLDGCRGGGVYLLGCSNISMEHLEIRRYRGDAISFQQCVDVWVRQCHLHDNAGHGLHPGSGSVRYVMADNHIHDNGVCGIFYCLRTTHSICRNNRIEANGAEGITIGERDTDHLVEGNQVRHNGKAGLVFRIPQVESGDRVIVRGNLFANNQRTAGGPELEIGPRLRSVHVLNNRFETAAVIAVRVAEDCQDIALSGNQLNDAPLAAEHVEAASLIAWSPPKADLPVGPAHLPLDGARHLRIDRIAPWQDRPACGRAETVSACIGADESRSE